MTNSPTDGEAEVLEEDFEIVVVEKFSPIDPTGIKAKSPKRYIDAVTKAEFEVQAATTRTLQKQAPFKTGAKAGEAKPDIDVTHLWVLAFIRNAAVMLLHFKGGSFVDARVWDVAGWPTELWANYEPNANTLRRAKDEPEKPYNERVRAIHETAQRMSHDYNDGTFRVNQQPRVLSKGLDFEDWLADVVPGFVPRKPPVRKATQAEATAAQLIEIGEWKE